eukprot:3723671-Alexandrium_andersonii.AAC.1
MAGGGSGRTQGARFLGPGRGRLTRVSGMELSGSGHVPWQFVQGRRRLLSASVGRLLLAARVRGGMAGLLGMCKLAKRSRRSRFDRSCCQGLSVAKIVEALAD